MRLMFKFHSSAVQSSMTKLYVELLNVSVQSKKIVLYFNYYKNFGVIDLQREQT